MPNTRTLRIDTPSLLRTAGGWRVSAEVAGTVVWFESDDTALLAAPEAFASLFLLPALAERATLVSDAPLDPRWLENAAELVELFSRWWRYPALVPRATAAAAAEPSRDAGAALFFSGGVDSFHSLLCCNESPRLLVMVQGFDFGLDDVVRAKAAHDSMREVAAALGIATGFIRTNVREHPLVRAVAWERTNGGALAAVGHLLAASHSEVLISSSISTRWNEPWGSHLEVDARFSSSRVRFRTVATAHRRMEKIQEVARQTLPRTHLRVCWQNRTATGNCSRCDKCVITRLVLAEAGELEHFTTFEGPATLPAHLDAIRSDKRIQTLAEMSQSEHLEPAIRRSARGLYERSVRRYSLPVRLRRALVHLWHGWRGTPQR